MSEWEIKKLGEVVSFASGGTPSKKESDYWCGNIPWISAATMHNREIYTSDLFISKKGLKFGSKLASTGDLLLLVRGSILWKKIPVCICRRDVAFNQDVKSIKTNERIMSDFLLYWFLSHEKQLLRKVVATGIGAGKLDFDLIKSLEIPVPRLLQQREIVNFLGQWSKGIEELEALIDAREREFQSLVTRLISKSGGKKRKLSDFVKEVSQKNKSSQIERVLSVTNHSGFVLPEDQFERCLASSNVTKYKIVRHGQYAYNPSRINVGSIARLDKWSEAILSPMYIVFTLNEALLDSDYFLYWLSSNETKQRIKRSAQGSVRETVSFGDLAAIPIYLPDLSTQRNISNMLNAAKKEISILKKLADQYRKEKYGLMKKLLSGQCRIKNDEAI